MTDTGTSNESATPLVGVVGAGVIGSGVAQSLAASGHRVVLHDVDGEALARARQSIRRGLSAKAIFGAGAARQADVLQRIEFTCEMTQLADAAFVIENAVEKWPVKCRIYADLDRICRADAVFAANTSTFPIADFAALVRHGERVIGMHFMNPVPEKRVVEVIRGEGTGAQTLARAQALLAAMGKEGVIVRDSPGFVTNRVLMLTINEAIRTVEEGIAAAEEVDRLFCGCFGHAMGPLATADLIGLDTILLSLESLRERFADSKFEPAALLRRFVAEGRNGRKSGSGFFSYAL